MEQTGDVARRKTHRTTTRCEAGNFPRNACVGTPGGIVHGVSACATGARAMAAAATTPATTSAFMSSPFRSAGCTVLRVAVPVTSPGSVDASNRTDAAESPTIDDV